MKTTNIEQIQKIIELAIPTGSVIPRHTDKGHFYEVVPLGRVLKSVTGKTSIIKDESIINFKMNRSLELVEQMWKLFTDDNIEDMLELAKRAPTQDFIDAGEVGSQIHNERELYMRQWIETKEKPHNILSFHTDTFDTSTPTGRDKNLQVIAGLRGVEKFCNEFDYLPAVCELYVYDDKLETAGTLDDLGTIRVYVDKGNSACQHEMKTSPNGNSYCTKCDRRTKRELALIDIKSSNQFKDSYWIQVILYYYMFYNLTKLKPSHIYIIKVSKEDGFYKPEKLKDLPLLIKSMKSVVQTSDLMVQVKELRKKETVRL